MAKIVRNPKILAGKPTIAGTRISVELILNLIENGQTFKDIMDDYDLTEDQIRAAVEFARVNVVKNYPPQTAVAHEIFARRKHK